MKSHAISIPPDQTKIDIFSLGCMPYPEADRLQRQTESGVREDSRPETVFLLEHPHTLTLGRFGSAEDILVPSSRLDESGVSLIRSDRGGKVTYHGPGQLVGYMIFNLYRRRLSVPLLVWRVEELIRCVLMEYGLPAGRIKGYPGVWLRGRKIASIGFHVTRGITRHGFALNVDPDLTYFDWILPCGERTPVTSMARELSSPVGREALEGHLKREIKRIFA